MVEFREALLKTTAPTTVEKLMKTITPPKGVRIRESSDVAPDEGKEFFDCKGKEIGEEDMHLESEEANEYAQKTLQEEKRNVVKKRVKQVEHWKWLH